MKRWLEIGALILGGLCAAFVLWAVFIRPGQKADEATRAKGDSIVATGEASKAADAIPIIEKHFTNRERIERVTIQGNAGIMAAAGAQDRIPADVDRAARAALCLHQIYRDNPACQFLPDVDPRRDEGVDAGGAAAG